MVLPYTYKRWYKYIALAASVVQVALCIWLYAHYMPTSGSYAEQFQFLENKDWISLSLGQWGILKINYSLGIDGISVLMLLLSAIIMLVATLASWEITAKLRGYFILLLVLNTSIMGVFCALDFFLFYVFYEFMLLPLFFLIGIWGGARREYASLKFFIYTLAGSVFMLLAIIGLYLSATDATTGLHTFDIIQLTNPLNYLKNGILTINSTAPIIPFAREWAFALIFIAFAIKVPIVPLHTWLPDAHVEAPTPISIILAGILLKVGAYGIIRICYPIFPDVAQHYAQAIAWLGVISIIYGAFNALAQTDLKRLVAYSSISHMGFVLVGIASLTPEGMNGAVFQMYSHGILSPMLFFLVGMLYSRTHSRTIADYRGLSSRMPVYTFFVLVAYMASLGMPGFSAFIGEFFSITGAFIAIKTGFSAIIPILALVGIILGAVYLLWTLQRMFFGTLRLKEGDAWLPRLTDVNALEYVVLVLLTGLSLSIGLMPNLVFERIGESVLAILGL